MANAGDWESDWEAIAAAPTPCPKAKADPASAATADAASSATEVGGPQLGGLFARKKKTLGIVVPHEPAAKKVCCRICGEEFTVPADLLVGSSSSSSSTYNPASGQGCSKDDLLCDDCRQELVWETIRGWVLLSALWAQERAFPAWGVEVAECWDDEGAVERAALAASASSASGGGKLEAGLLPSDFARIAVLAVQLPPDLLAKVLEYTVDGVSEVFAPSDEALQSLKDAKKRYLELPAVPRRRRRYTQCCQHLMQQGKCLHGKVVTVRSQRRSVPPTKHLQCWYCDTVFDISQIQEMQDHAEIEHGQTLNAWVRKNRKNKARENRQWYQAGSNNSAQSAAAAYMRTTARG
eukprot:TRINITY_DN82438_c0_g1_i1.p1 TRINITY_DN82438_c0_g1~~TRINITY_DN82438_c0_g1_i1.p1  ORF type:complete len:351 (-),score=93.10 TRINITY_DN82438_c0_g1_i1:57-1109(-)